MESLIFDGKAGDPVLLCPPVCSAKGHGCAYFNIFGLGVVEVTWSDLWVRLF